MILWRKLWREVQGRKGTLIAASLVMTVGVMIFIAFFSTSRNLYQAKESYYEELQFAHIFAQVRQIPETELEYLQGLPGLEALEGRIVQDLSLQDGKTLRLISLPEDRTSQVNDIRFVEGSRSENALANLVLDPAFATANALQVGDFVELLVKGRLVSLEITGLAISAEYIYTLRDGAEMAPDPEGFGIAYITHERAQELFDLQGLYNEIVFRSSSSDSASIMALKDLLEEELKPYGLISIYDREKQISHAVLMQEIEGLEIMASYMAVVFLLLSSFMLFNLLHRLVKSQRKQIGTLLAFGYHPRQILLHFMVWGLGVAFLGWLFGVLLGTTVANGLTEYLVTYFKLPDVFIGFDGQRMAIAFFLAALGGALAGYLGARSVLRLEPAEAMRAEAPQSGKAWPLHRLPFWPLLPFTSKLILRNLLRNPGRSLLTFVGLLIAYILTVTGMALDDSVNYMFEDYYVESQPFDYQVYLAQPLPADDVISEIEAWPEVHFAEGHLIIPARLKSRGASEEVALLGIEEEGRLYRLLDKEGADQVLYAEGLTLSERLAEQLNVKAGDTVQVEFLLGEPLEELWTIAQVIPQYIGYNAFLPRQVASKVIGERDVTTSLLLKVEPTLQESLEEKLQEADGINTYLSQIRLQNNLAELMETMIYTSIVIVTFAMISGVTSLYAVTSLNLEERRSELATLKVLGFSKGQMLAMIAGENGLLALGAVLAGIPLSTALVAALLKATSTDFYEVPLYYSVDVFLWAGLAIVSFVLLAHLLLYRKLVHFDMVEVFKEREG
ncbi:ABC transporter permease [Heliorestis acidaminivorans]|uniref:ABC transporter permease n=1 Tax=Heliorestis acidaminivorans TaxID=553427 RepID=A0A6I0EPH3_9FIRM|nr:ABC transporter permease [Heliorestis acidaminivorans]KAB2951818.1 ABC transporter permease [Heliorestis acidaminivorans]